MEKVAGAWVCAKYALRDIISKNISSYYTIQNARHILFIARVARGE